MWLARIRPENGGSWFELGVMTFGDAYEKLMTESNLVEVCPAHLFDDSFTAFLGFAEGSQCPPGRI